MQGAACGGLAVRRGELAGPVPYVRSGDLADGPILPVGFDVDAPRGFIRLLGSRFQVGEALSLYLADGADGDVRRGVGDERAV